MILKPDGFSRWKSGPEPEARGRAGADKKTAVEYDPAPRDG